MVLYFKLKIQVLSAALAAYGFLIKQSKYQIRKRYIKARVANFSCPCYSLLFEYLTMTIRRYETYDSESIFSMMHVHRDYIRIYQLLIFIENRSLGS